jgi:spermidine synthase
VAIVGAGTGNDVAAALRSGAEHVEAIEIDPAIQLTGKLSHPEKPYSDARVHAVVNDARSFLRTTEQTFDLVVYGMLDSHTLLSQGSSVRLDSFVYTVEGLREARTRLKPDGVLSLSFSVLSDA